MRLITVQLVIYYEVRDIEVIQIPMRAIRISVSDQCYLLRFLVSLVCPHLIKEQPSLGLIADFILGNHHD